ncbi:MAG TPA: VIT domain-containing protein, partial [Sandaracinaceae bacterium]
MRSLVPALLAACALAACGGGSQEVDATVATVVPVRGATALEGSSVARVARASSESAVTTADRSLARVSLDLGPELLLGPSTELSVLDAMTVQLARGKVFAQTLPGEQLALRFAHGSLRCSDASLSAELEGGTLTVYVVRGEVAWTRGDERGIASPGEELVLGPSSAETRAAVLWHDWTGGLARPGPGDASGPAGVGTLEARVPDEIGLARWPLVIRRLDVRVRIDEDLAVTEVDQLFFNPASETVEGLYRIRVPEGAVLQRFAVDRDDRLVDGYVRERAQARRSYEEQVYRGSTEDPALLEWDAPGSYRARIYPIHPGETRRIVIRYAEWLRPPEEGAPRLYRYPMGGGESAPHIQELSISADVSNAGAERVRAGMGAQVEKGAVRIRRSDFRPHADFWMELVGGEAHPQRAWVADYEPPARAPDAPAMPNEADERDFFYLPLVLPVSLAGGARADGLDLVVLADVSAATDRSHLELGRSVVESLTAHLDASDRVAVVTSDLTIRSVVPGDPALVEATPENVERLLDGLARAPAGGATDLGQALEDAAALLDPARPSAIVYVGDGAPTVGELRAEGLLERLARLPHPIRLYAVGVGSEANLDLLEALTRGGGLALRVEERAQAADAALRVLAHLQRPVAHDVVVDLGNGIENAFPRRPMDAVLGEVFPVVGRVRGELPSVARVSMKIGGREIAGHEIPLEVVETDASTDLRLRWAAERLRQLLLDGASREEVVELGTRYGLITPFTSYYVPSRSELARMGALSSALVDRPLLEVGGPSTARRIAEGVAAIALGPLSIAGCSVLNEEEGAAPSVPLEEGQAEGSATPEAAEAPAAPAPPPEPAAQASAGAHADVAALRTPAGTAEAEPAPAAAPAPRGAEYARE